MAEYIMFMHGNVDDDGDNPWHLYIDKLKKSGRFEGGSTIGDGVCLRKDGMTLSISERLVGYIRVSAESVEHAGSLLSGNPHYEAGGAIEIRELPRSSRCSAPHSRRQGACRAPRR